MMMTTKVIATIALKMMINIATSTFTSMMKAVTIMGMVGVMMMMRRRKMMMATTTMTTTMIVIMKLVIIRAPEISWSS